VDAVFAAPTQGTDTDVGATSADCNRAAIARTEAAAGVDRANDRDCCVIVTRRVAVIDRA
jgi:hypothetical protein